MRSVVYTTASIAVTLLCWMSLGSSNSSLVAGTFVPADEYEQTVLPLFSKYCFTCHSGAKSKGDLDLSPFKTSQDLFKKLPLAESILTNVRNGDMPPANKPKPTRAELDKMIAYLDGAIVKAHLKGKRDPGRVTMRRLNRNEYNNTIRDLLEVDFKPAEDFPLDDIGYGFDNIGEVLTIPPLLLEKYLNAAQLIVDRALMPKVNPYAPTVRRYQGRELQPRSVGSLYGKNNQTKLLSTNSEVFTTFDFPREGRYAFRLRAFGQQAGNEPPKLDLKLDGKTIKTFSVVPVESDSDGKRSFEFITKVTPGSHKVSLAFTNDYMDQATKKDRNVAIQGMSIEGPLDAPKVVLKHPVLTVTPEGNTKPREAARLNLIRLTERAFRRPVKPEEVEKFLKLFDAAQKRGDNFTESMKLPVQAILISPHFLFRVENDNNTVESVRRLNDFELASRLSYFLWSSMPDEALYESAKLGKLSDPDVLLAQTRRMLKDPKSNALVENFAGQWLQLRNLKVSTPDTKRFPTFDDALKAAMLKETELFFQEMLTKDHPITTFLDADFTYLNEKLANHYGITTVKGNEFKRTSLAGTQRRGILTQASILTLTSNPTRTSPVKRGKWVLETILGTPPPPPPPDAGELSEAGELKGTLRQRMEQHRANPNCATCHNRMDPIGFGFENFDAVGKWRLKDGTFPIEPGGTLPTGQSFQSALDLVKILKQRDEDFRRCLTEKMLTYSLGRGLDSSDRQYVADIAKTCQTKGDSLSALIQTIVISEPFTQRRTAKGGS